MSQALPSSPEQLIVRRDLRIVRSLELTGGPLTIGRSPQCDITLSHDAVSRHHASLEQRPDGWHIVDTGSINGIRVNGERVPETRLLPGDVIEIRPFALNCVAGDTAVGDSSIEFGPTHVTHTISRPPVDSGVVVKQRLEDLYALSRLVLHRKDDGSFWPEVHAALQRSLAADRCVLVGVGDDDAFYRLAPRGRPCDARAPLGLSRSVLRQVAQSGRGVLVPQVATDERFAQARSLAGSEVGSVLCAPVLVRRKARAVVYADRQSARMPFTEDDLDFVIAGAELAATAVDLDELQDHARELSHLRGRVDAAREMQELLLPLPLPQPPWGRVAAVNHPAEQISGDIYDAMIDDHGRLVLSIADVSGKGVPAAFATAILHNLTRHCLAETDDLGEAVRRINKSFDTQSPADCFATMVICRWSPAGDRVEIANAGHLPPLWATPDGQVEAFPGAMGPPLGILPVWPGTIVTRDTSPGNATLLYSDGVTEARNREQEEYELTRLTACFQELAARAPEHILTGVIEDVAGFSAGSDAKDDLTMVAIR